jgi:hypothetical protein
MSRFDRFRDDGPKGEELARIQRGIDATMRDVIRTSGYDVHARGSMLGPTQPAKPAQPQPAERPLAPPPGLDLIDRLVNAELPHGPKSKAK